MANWFYSMSGGSSCVEVVTGGNIPTIPGSILNDFKALSVTTPASIKDTVNKVWSIDITGKLYSSLPKLSNIGEYRVSYWWAGRYNKSVGGKTHTLEFPLDGKPSNKFYMGGFCYWNSCANHQGATYNNYGLTMTATVTYADGTTENFVLRSPYIGNANSIGAYTVFHSIGNVYTTSKPMTKLSVKSVFTNCGAVWHDIGDRGYNNGSYNNVFNSNKGGYFKNQLFNIDYTAQMNCPYWNGGLANDGITDIIIVGGGGNP